MMCPQKRFCFAAVATLVLLSLVFSGCQTQQLLNENLTPKASVNSPLAVVLTTDCGADIDDQWALVHLLLSPELDLRAVITTHAASVKYSSAASAQCATGVLAHVPPASAAPRPPVVSGSDVPLHDVKTPRDNPGVDLLLRISREFSESRRLVVFVIGAGTDVASAILMDPTITKRIKLVAMGFDEWPTGGDGFNVKNDPLAWQVILTSDAPLVIGSSEVTKRGLRLTRAEAAALMRSHGPIGEYLYSLFDQWLEQQADLVAHVVAPATWVVWDEVVVAYVLGMTNGNEVPRPQLQSSLSFSHPETSRRITWLAQIDTEKVWRDFTEKIDGRDVSKGQP
jgi:inosine-uridine nucleoside N-ribohydrolase